MGFEADVPERCQERRQPCRSVRAYLVKGFTPRSVKALSKQRKRGAIFALHLLERRLLWGLVRTPAQEFGPVPKSSTAKVIELHFDDKFGCEGLPIPPTLCSIDLVLRVPCR